MYNYSNSNSVGLNLHKKMSDSPVSEHEGVIWDIRSPIRHGLLWIGYAEFDAPMSVQWERKLTQQEIQMYDVFTAYTRSAGIPGVTGVPPTNVLVTLFKTSVTIEQIACLKPREWLNNWVVDTYMSYLGAYYKNRGGTNNIYVADSAFFAGLSSAVPIYPGASACTHHAPNTDSVKRLFYPTRNRQKFSELDVFLTPVNIEGVHWALLVLFPKTRKILFLDSLTRMRLRSYRGGTSQTFVKAYVDEFITAIHKAEFGADASPLPWSAVTFQPTQQSNGYDCGVFTCAYGAYVLDGAVARLAHGSFSRAFVQPYRRHVFVCLLSHGGVPSLPPLPPGHFSLQSLTERSA